MPNLIELRLYSKGVLINSILKNPDKWSKNEKKYFLLSSKKVDEIDVILKTRNKILRIYQFEVFVKDCT